MTHTNEFSRLVDLLLLTPKDTVQMTLEATDAELKALSRRLAPVDVVGFRGALTISENSHHHIHVRGSLQADLIQECGRTLKRVLHTLSINVEELFIRASDYTPVEEEDESSLLELEVVEGDTFDVGEVATQNLSLAIDPYFMSDETIDDKPLEHREHDDKLNPFEALQALKDKNKDTHKD